MGNGESVENTANTDKTVDNLQPPPPLTSNDKIYSQSEDIYMHQQFIYHLQSENYANNTKIKESENLYVDNFYVEILKQHNQKILEISEKDPNLLLPKPKPQKRDRLTDHEIEKINFETNTIYQHTIPALLADIKNLELLIEQKKQMINQKPQSHQSNVVFAPDCSLLDA
ncbi:hypothetical protein TRFO_32196 [Tritrichomonas foetus]|uniref:Uncharacterized protein n=1 Tax=Tritrichomonas foetus TaxID=1144522 RepID=A0A1J4JUL2_9EUKA|nr:hypothetical protein TRFO_32196 [Tritrichomonas foetus]|eukprot:OHT00941.1 hypothetical protein TRFO_32196 [Tritrichomonas foetus]